ncbi:rubrerythrin family protein [Halomicroarcula sp. GCM10025709]|uniref:rubrerythrin family protein n=1 Tax=Haloarcula TaxID=2237 RepID=UPI0024C2A406|nr:rubrerythrin family protein [Halomicroarcula sp. YJ-61-S]
MNADDLVEAVRDDQQTELSRLGSSKMLYADTRGEMEPETVTAAAAAREQAAHETFDAWSEDADAPSVFADAAAGAADRLEATDAEPADREFAVYGVLADFDGTVERLGGLLGWTLVDKKVKEQLTGFFTGQADPQTASTYRSAGSDIEALRADAGDALETVCESDADWDAAETAAIAVVEAAYEEYFETLEELGVNPKPVC